MGETPHISCCCKNAVNKIIHHKKLLIVWYFCFPKYQNNASKCCKLIPLTRLVISLINQLVMVKYRKEQAFLGSFMSGLLRCPYLATQCGCSPLPLKNKLLFILLVNPECTLNESHFNQFHVKAVTGTRTWGLRWKFGSSSQIWEAFKTCLCSLSQTLSHQKWQQLSWWV